MKKVIINSLYLLIVALAYQFIGISAFAQSPQKISYQAAVRKADGFLLISAPVGVRLSILQGSSSGSVVYSETHTVSTNANGIMSLEIGTGNLGGGPLLSTINWKTGGPYFIKTETDPTGGTTYTIEGTTQLTSIPYAFYAPTAGNSFDGNYNSLTNKPATDGSETKITGGTFVSVTGNGTGTPNDPYIINSNPVIGGYSHYLGEYYNGGIIFYLYKGPDGTENALIANLSESTQVLQDPSNNTGATSLWDGAGNTAKYTTNSPAATYVAGLGSGWYIPSIDELNILWQNRYHVNRGLSGMSGTLLSHSIYWSSTEVSSAANLAFNLDFYTGAISNGYAKGSPGGFKIRAVRGLVTSSYQLTTKQVTNVTNVSASSGGNIYNDGGSPITARGVCWSTSQNPTVADSKTTDGAGTGSFTSTITGLTINVTYYVRAYATNASGTVYGSQKYFTTKATAPVVTTTAISPITQTGGTGGGNVTDERGSSVTVRGVCWNTSPNPTTANNTTSNGTGGGVFVSSITGLTPRTTYYVRAYATNAVGTSYGSEVSFTTIALPIVTTNATVTPTIGGGATTGGNVTDAGGLAITARGVCWNTATNPTIANSKTTDGTGTGPFTSTPAGLTLGFKYYLRAYATNSEGTSYGAELVFWALTVGDTYQGGKVAHIYVMGEDGWVLNTLHGLIAAPADQGTGIEWSNIADTDVPALHYTNGNTNSINIIAQFGHSSSAAKICLDLTLNSKSDWYLPAYDELTWLIQNYSAIGGFVNGNNYWSSTEYDATQAWTTYFDNTSFPNWGLGDKSYTYRVRPVRRF